LPQQIIIKLIKEKLGSRQIKGTGTVSVISGNNKNKIRCTKNRTGNENEQVREQGNIIKQAVTEAATETTGEAKRTRNEWYDEECRKAIREKMRLSYACYRERETYDKHQKI
jgi:hypothetical protein